MTNAIVFNDFTFRYDVQKEPTLKHLNLTIAEGEKVVIIGASGSGKSTLGQLINGLIPHHHKGEMTGDFTMAGKPAYNLSIYEKSRLVSTVLQDTDGQFIGLSVAEDLAFALENDEVATQEMHHSVAQWANQLDLSELISHRPQDLSGGQKQRVSLGGVLIDESPILLFDEPLANLDPKTSLDTVALIDKIHREQRVTTIIIEHRLEEVLSAPVDRLILLDDGEICFDGTPDDLLKSDLLEKHGIREPLYISSLRDLGYDLNQFDQLLSIADLPLSPKDFSLGSTEQTKKAEEVLFELKQVSLTYPNGKEVLKNLSLSVNKGDRLSIVGKNGAGKSTLAKVLCQFLPTNQGKFIYQGKDCSQDSIKERSAKIGYVLQNPNHMISQTMIADEVALGLRLEGVAETEIKERLEHVLKVCGLYAFRDWPISALSYGQKKRVTIASILILNPDIILLDEPTAGQDLKHYKDMMYFLDQLNALGHTIMMITHDMQLMLEHSDRTIVLVDGHIIADDKPFVILSDQEIIEQANLRKTSLFDLAKALQTDPKAVTQAYIEGRGKVND